MHREKPAFNAGEQKKENRGIPRETEQDEPRNTAETEQDKPRNTAETGQNNNHKKKGKKENGKDHNDVRDCVYIGTRGGTVALGR